MHTCFCAGGRAAALLALEEGRASIPADDTRQPAPAVRATNYTLWRQDGAAYEVDWEEVTALSLLFMDNLIAAKLSPGGQGHAHACKVVWEIRGKR